MAENQQPSKEQLLTALENAHLAGDTEAARQFASWHNELYPEPAPPEKPGIMQRVSNALSFGEPEVDGFTGAARNVPEGPQMVAYEPTLWDKIKGIIPANKDAAWVEYQARQIAKEQGVSVDEVYKSVGGSRPVFNPEGRPTIQALAEATDITIKELPDLIPGAANTVMRSIRGGDETADKTWLDRAIDYTEPEPPENPDPNYDSFYGIGKSLGYSLSTMTSAITAGALTGLATKNPIAIGVAAGTTAGAVAYRGSRDEFLSRVQEGLNQKAMEIYGRELTQEEWDKAYAEFDAAATKYGAWEAIPEAVGNLVFLRAFTAPLKGMGKQKLMEITKRAATTLGTENVTETATAVGQNRAELEAGMTDEELTVGDAFRKQVVPTTIVTGLMGGAGAGVKAGVDASKSKERRLGEVLNQIVDESHIVGPDAATAFDPSNAQVQEQSQRPTMAELVAERLKARGIEPKPAVEEEPIQAEVVTNEKPIQETPAEEQAQEKSQPQDAQYGEGQERIEHTTKRGRVLTGIIDREMTLDEAKNIDPYAFRKDGGVFIRDGRIKEFNQAQEDRNATVDTGSAQRPSDNAKRGAEPQQDSGKPAESGVDQRTGDIGASRPADLPVSDAAQRDDKPLTGGKPIGRAIDGSTIYEESNGKRYKLRGGARVYEPVGIEMGSSPTSQQRDEFFLTEDEVAVNNSKDYRALQKRISNISQEKNPESIKLKSESVTRAINNSDLSDQQKQELLDQLPQEVANEPTELDTPSREALEGAPAEALPDAQEATDSQSDVEPSSREDVDRGERAGESGLPAGRSVPDGEREVPVPAAGEQRAEQPSESVAGDVPTSDRDEAQNTGSRSAGDKPAVAAKEKAAEQAPTPEGETTQKALPSDERPAGMFTITADTGIGQGGAKTKFKNNLEAINTLKAIEREGRQATPEEQQVLAKYVGWGGLPQAFYGDSGKVAKGWDKEAQQLKEALTDAEYEAARRSTQDAHYTSYEIVSAIWKAVKELGFSGGRVLEPSVGTGNFLGIMPGNVRGRSQVSAVELDRITGGIAKHLYPKANIKTPMGFQDFTMPSNYFDLAIGNPPFGSQKLYDGRRKDLSKFSIHNYFFAKSLDGLRPGGVLAMVVSNRLMDGLGNKVAREYMAARADLLGAVRLPNNAFLKNAGTEVTTDIIFLQKRAEGTPRKGDSWVRTEVVRDSKGIEVPTNEYFINKPEMMLGEWGAFGSMYGPNDPALIAKPEQNTSKMLAEALAKLPKGIMSPSGAAVNQEVKRSTSIEGVKVGSMFMDGGTVSVKQLNELGDTVSEQVEFPSEKARKRVEGMISVRDVFTDLRKAQLTEGVKESALSALRDKLNSTYDAFVKSHGPINADANKRLFRDDPSWPQIAALEDSFDKGITPTVAKRTGETPRKPSAKKAAIFTKRTQEPYKAPTKAASAKDAMAASLSELGSVDMDYMSRLYGKTPDKVAQELGDLVYEQSPGDFVARDEYLSGNVKQKLAEAKRMAADDKRFKRNVDALEAVQPEDIEAVDIEVKPGAHWLPPEDMSAFVEHISGDVRAKAVYIPVNAKWTISATPTEGARAKWGTNRATVSDIVSAAANQKQIVIRDRVDESTTVLNEAATNAANEKVERVKSEFRRWIWKDDARRNRLSRKYNDTFNTDRLREYDGSHLTFPGKISDDIINLRPHQANGVWRIMQNGTTLLDHIVGAGKTFTMVAGAMELRRTGRARKPMFVVPNHLVSQWAEDFTKLYPGANVLAATKKDFEKSNRKRLFARIATGDWDAVIVAHSSFGKVEMDAEFQEQFINEQIRDIDEAIQNIRAQDGKDSRSIKQVEKQKERLQEKLKKLFDADNKDDNLTFGELGVDALFVDEAHEFKNLGFATGMTRVAGLGSPQGSQKAADLFMKTQFVLRKTGGNNVVFATGTPISNTMAEMYTMQRYLDYQALKDQGIAHFDAWARMYGEAVTDWELSPSGTYKLNSRFSKFVNIPELMQRYLSFGDVINRDDINRQLAAQGKRLPVPKIKGGKPSNVVVERSADQAAYIGEPVTDENGRESYPEGSLVWRAEHLPKKAEKGGDNMLKIMSDARKAALDMRMIDPALYVDYGGSKINKAAKSIKRTYDKWNADKGTQLVFIDLSTPKGAKAAEAARIRDLIERADNGDEVAQDQLDKMSPDELSALEGDFSVYDDLKQKLINEGIPASEIAFIHDANTELQKEELFGKVRSGRVRVLFGSTAKMGAGMNVQDRLVALHHMDAPWRPSDLEQREGRIIRQGNKLYERDPDGFQVEINRYATKQTLDSRMWQTIETKARFIEQVRKGNSKTREIEDVGGEASNAAEMRAASSGNPLILEEMDLRQKIRKLEQLEDEHDREQFRIRDQVRRLKLRIEQGDQVMLKLTDDASKAKKAPKDFLMTVDGGSYNKRKDAGDKILSIANKMADAGQETQEIGSYAGFNLRLDNISGAEFVVTIQGKQEYQADIPDIAEADAAGLATRIVNAVKRIPDEAKSQAEIIAQAKRDIPDLESQISDWGKADELAKTKARHALIIAELQPKSDKQQTIEQDQESAMMSSMGADVPMPNWTPTYRQAGVPRRPDSDKFDLGSRSVDLKPEDKPTRREGIRVMVEDVIGPRLYQGKVRGKSKLGFYKRNNSEVRVSSYDDVEVMAHEMAHYLDMHYRFNEKFTRAYKDRRFKPEVESLSYTSDKKLRAKEGFAEYVRLWLTNYDAAKTGAPLFTSEFEKVLRTDESLSRKMTRLQDEMHRWYMQGPRAQLRAKSGKELSQSEQITQYMQSYPLERYRQEVIDKIHAAKVVERTLKGGVGDAALSPYKQFQMVNGAESLHESIMKDGTPSLSADGTSYEISGKGLNEIFAPVAKHGWKRFDLLMDYFKARRANELMKQGRERLFTKEEIQSGLKLGVTYPEFREVFKEYQEFNQRMLDFYVDMGLLDYKQRSTFAEANRNYVPFHRVIERLEDGQDGGTTSAIGRRLAGGSQNVRDIAENIVEGLYANVRAALIARAKQTLYRDIMQSQDGSLFAAKLSPDSKLVKVHNSQMAAKVAETMANVGLTVSKDGMIMAGDAENQVTDVDDIAEALESNPDLLTFWTFGHKPNTVETYVDSAIIDGKRVWFEVRNPLLVDMLTGLRGFRSGALLNAMFRVKNLQTRTVTSMLQFLGPNAIRDTLSAFVISKNKFIPVWSTLRGMGDVIFNTDIYKEFRRQGGGYGTRIEARTEETRERRRLDLPSKDMWDRAAKLLAGYDRFASAFEYGSRLGDYRAARAAGKTPLEAAWEAREVATDFSKMGRNELWAKFLRTVPFMNAGIQGMDKTAREIFEMRGEMKGSNLAKVDQAKLRFLAAGGSITVMTAILWLLNNDDDRYKGLTADQKARFWWIFIPGAEKPLKIPRPYDIGHIFATIPEVSLDYIKDRDGKAAADTLAWTMVNTLGIGDYPGIFQPIIEVKTNKKFTGAPVVPYRLTSVPAEYQFTDRTPQIYREIGEALGVSPLVAEHYTKGYLRYVEAYISDASEAMLWNDEQWGERPFSDKGPIDYLTYQFQGQKVPYRTKWTEGYFELKKKAAGMKNAFDLLTAQAIRDDSKVKEFSREKVNQLLINMDAAFGKIVSAFRDQEAVLAAIKYDPNLSKEDKEARIEHWYSQKNNVLAKFYEQANTALREAEKQMSGE